ncbi:vegetative incompatibility protein HET-E-1 [Ceratobasidium theobromae]|uniref:Vegetative incompatibility protein HET-E-1 n=1 Tax=Ceratobasidium theobromae TaxID=1582974 RepID=A0A5N5QJA6_9AGAM|nr:vegetative incompatibility protein HET-E-1 [Ceratobasidium theobromae]
MTNHLHPLPLPPSPYASRMSNPKRRFRDSVSRKLDKLFRSSSPAPSGSKLSTNLANPQAPLSTPNLLSPPTQGQGLPVSTTPTPPPAGPLASASSLPNPDSTSNPGWNGLRTTLRSLHKCAGVFPPLQSAISSVIKSIEVMEMALKQRDDYEDLAADLKTLGDILVCQLQESKSTPMSEFIERIAISIEEQAKQINDQPDRGTGRYLTEANYDEELSRCYRRIEGLFRQLQVNASLSTWNIAGEQLANSRLEGMTPAKLANYDSRLSADTNRRTCTKDTRTAILVEFNIWSCDPNAPNIYWMSGMAGTGKTTLACTFCETLKKRKQLGASFFCTRTTAECRDVGRIIPTIAYQLARYSLPFQSALCRILGNDPDLSTRMISTQFERLLRDPILEVKDAIPENLIVVIDALDECSDSNGVGSILDILFRHGTDLPLKFFVTSRPEPSIWQRMQSQSVGARSVFVLHEIERSLVQADIELYLAEELEFMSPSPAQVQKLAELSGNLFIYAATAVRYIRAGSAFSKPSGRLLTVLAVNSNSSKKHAEIDKLYSTILAAALEDENLENEEKELIQVILWTAVCAREPVGVDILAALGGISDSDLALAALQPLRSVLYVSENSHTVTTLHASFPDFMFDQARSLQFFCDEAKHSHFLAQRCFKLMKGQLRFNICDLKSSCIRDKDVKDLDDRIKQLISPTLLYICRYWSDHLCQAPSSEELFPCIDEFLSVRLLFWMEVMNLKCWMKIATKMLLTSKLWIMRCPAPSNLVVLVEDSRRFVASFTANPVSESTPHIYISSLPFCHRSSSVFKNFWKQTHGLIDARGTVMEQREGAPLAVWNTGQETSSITFSPDDTRIAFGTYEGTIMLRDADDGSSVAGPLKGHEDMVWSVAFSPDGKYIASGSDDSTILIWDANNGTHVAGPYKGHTGTVKSITFSPDSARIISGSSDTSIYVWSVQDGIPILAPFLGHTKGVNSVAISPDGIRIISGSDDHTIYIWNAQNGTPFVSPLIGHSLAVNSVAFSPDGTRIVSGSEDHTILIWGAFDGARIVGPFMGHSDIIFSVMFSPDGTCVVSGSADTTVRVWSSTDGVPIGNPFKGHADLVTSVAFSADGTRIVSGSDDCSIRVWNAHNNVPSSSPLLGHTYRVLSIALSLDGTWIVSGSADDTICIWDANNGILVAGPMVGHTKYVTSVAFSPSGTRIASGSNDCTIIVWDALNGSRIAGPLQGHTHGVTSVSFSPDGTCIVSGSEDKTLRVWGTHDYTLVAGPFEGHTKAVNSVAFSPSGAYIASGSDDRTIIIWDAFDGTRFTDPLEGHNDSVLSVAFSPDGTRIASGSFDLTIRVWSAHSGALIAGPFKVHTRQIRSVAFSPDGTQIVSGSDDRTVTVSDASNGTVLAGPFKGHTGWVYSVKFSPDGTRVVSCSDDITIRIWKTPDSTSSAQTSLPESGFSLTNNQKKSLLATQITVDLNGWASNQNSGLLFWVPSEIARCLPVPHNPLVIGPQGSILIDYDGLFLGDDWYQCYCT